MTSKDRKQLQRIHHIYHETTDSLRALLKNPSSKLSKKAYSKLTLLNKTYDLDFDNELDILKRTHNYRLVLINVMKKFNVYMLNHVEPDTKSALKIIHHYLKPSDYTSKFNQHHLLLAFAESYYYFKPCSDVSTLRFDLVHGNYFNLKGDLKTIESNREDLMHSSHNGNIKKFMGNTEAKSVKRHNNQ